MPSEIMERPEEEKIIKTAELFKVFGDQTRLNILYSLFDRELCVSVISDTVGMSSSAVSHQLKTLKQAFLVASRREGKTVYYRLADDHVRTMLDQAMEHICE